MDCLHSTVAQPEACLQSPGEDIWCELADINETSSDTGCMGSERPVPVVRPGLELSAKGLFQRGGARGL